MNDTTDPPNKDDCLFQLSSDQHGYFTSRQAEDCGISLSLLAYHVKRDHYRRVAHGLYRIKNYPSSPREDVIIAWLTIGKDKAVVSHESALELHGLSDVIPNAIHLTVPRSLRTMSKQSGVRIHTTTRQLSLADVTVRDGIKVTSVPRTIVDVASTGVSPEQIERAIQQATRQGMTTRRRLQEAATNQSMRVQRIIDSALEGDQQ